MADLPDSRTREAALVELAASTERLLATVRTVDDPAARAASALPGWTRGHVLTHLARNADGLRNLITWAETGVETPMYVSIEARVADIEAGAGRSAADLQQDVGRSAAELAERVSAMPEDALGAAVRMLSGHVVHGREIPLLRIREVELHLVDLDVGVTPDAWSETFCTRSLDQVTPGVAERGESPVGRLVTPDGRSWSVGSQDSALAGRVQDLLAWLTGRASGQGLEARGLDAVPAPPVWA